MATATNIRQSHAQMVVIERVDDGWRDVFVRALRRSRLVVGGVACTLGAIASGRWSRK
jgi:hypothetical protein